MDCGTRETHLIPQTFQQCWLVCFWLMARLLMYHLLVFDASTTLTFSPSCLSFFGTRTTPILMKKHHYKFLGSNVHAGEGTECPNSWILSRSFCVHWLGIFPLLHRWKTMRIVWEGADLPFFLSRQLSRPWGVDEILYFSCSFDLLRSSSQKIVHVCRLCFGAC